MKHRTLIASLIMASLLGTVPGVALADDRNDHKQWNEKQRNYRDEDHSRVRNGNQDYDYRVSRNYRPGRAGLIAAKRPVGAIVASLPFGFAAVVTGEKTYLHLDNTYSRRVPAGYMVCETPVATSSPRVHRNRFAGTVAVQSGRLNVRSGPGKAFAINGQVVRGERLHIHGTSNGWYYVKTPGGINGWVMQRFTSSHAAG